MFLQPWNILNEAHSGIPSVNEFTRARHVVETHRLMIQDPGKGFTRIPGALTGRPEIPGQAYSAFNALTGSTRLARRAGT